MVRQYSVHNVLFKRTSFNLLVPVSTRFVQLKMLFISEVDCTAGSTSSWIHNMTIKPNFGRKYARKAELRLFDSTMYVEIIGTIYVTISEKLIKLDNIFRPIRTKSTNWTLVRTTFNLIYSLKCVSFQGKKEILMSTQLWKKARMWKKISVLQCWQSVIWLYGHYRQTLIKKRRPTITKYFPGNNMETLYVNKD